MSQPQQSHSPPPIKKSKPNSLQGQPQAQDHKAQLVHEGQQHTQEAQEAQASATLGLESSTLLDSPQDIAHEKLGSQGLLEDMVPFMVRNPTKNANSSSYSPPTSPPSMWSSNYPTSWYTVGLNSSI